MGDHIRLKPRQEKVLQQLVDADLAIDDPEPFEVGSDLDDFLQPPVTHPGLPHGIVHIHRVDLEALIRQGLLAVLHRSKGDITFDVDQRAHDYCEARKQGTDTAQAISDTRSAQGTNIGADLVGGNKAGRDMISIGNVYDSNVTINSPSASAPSEQEAVEALKRESAKAVIQLRILGLIEQLNQGNGVEDTSIAAALGMDELEVRYEIEQLIVVGKIEAPQSLSEQGYRLGSAGRLQLHPVTDRERYCILKTICERAPTPDHWVVSPSLADKLPELNGDRLPDLISLLEQEGLVRHDRRLGFIHPTTLGLLTLRKSQGGALS